MYFDWVSTTLLRNMKRNVSRIENSRSHHTYYNMNISLSHFIKLNMYEFFSRLHWIVQHHQQNRFYGFNFFLGSVVFISISDDNLDILFWEHFALPVIASTAYSLSQGLPRKARSLMKRSQVRSIIHSSKDSHFLNVFTHTYVTGSTLNPGERHYEMMEMEKDENNCQDKQVLSL